MTTNFQNCGKKIKKEDFKKHFEEATSWDEYQSLCGIFSRACSPPTASFQQLELPDPPARRLPARRRHGGGYGGLLQYWWVWRTEGVEGRRLRRESKGAWRTE